MISERDLAEHFTVIWKQHFPLLTPNFMRVFNDSSVIPINKSIIETNTDVRYDLVSELAFNLAKFSFEENINITKIFNDPDILKMLVTKTVKSIWKSVDYTDKELIISGIEFDNSESLAINILDFIKIHHLIKTEFEPKLLGYGFLQNLIADLSIDDTLYEIKTVNRNFRSSDLKQLFIYLALQQVTGDKKWVYGGLYNPRKGVYCKFKISSLIYNLSGGKSSIEVFESFLNSLNRDVQIDSRF